VVAAAGGPEEFEVFLARYRNPTTPQEEMRYLYLLAGFSDPGLAARAFDLARTEVRTQNAPFLVNLLLAQRDVGASTWARVESAWDELSARLPANIFPRMLDGVKMLCRDETLARRVTAFVGAHPLLSGQRTVDQSLERLAVNVGLAAGLRPTVAATLDAGVKRLGPR